MGKRPWHVAAPALLERVTEETAATYPDLRLEVHDGLVRFAGLFRLLDDGEEVDRYHIEVVLPSDFPDSIPDVYEVGGRIPRDADHHMYSDGRACLFAPGERWRYWPRGSTLVEFLNGPVRSFFIGQALFERTGEWPFGQRPHGAIGILDAYGEMLRTRDAPIIVRYLEALARRKLRPRSPCPCGSGRPMHSCHMKKIADLRAKISRRDASDALAIILRAVRNAKEAPNREER